MRRQTHRLYHNDSLLSNNFIIGSHNKKLNKIL